MPLKTRAVICGGGVAGAGLAGALAQFGDDIFVTILEKDSTDGVGSVKRGEVIRPEVTKVLAETGLLEYVKKKNPVVRPSPKEEVWHSSSGKIGTIDYNILAKDYPMMYLPHRLLVQALHDKLRESASVVCVYGANVSSIERASNGEHVVHYDVKGDETAEKVSGDLIVVADSESTSALRNRLGISVDFVDYKVGYSMVILDKPSDLEWGRHCLSPDGFVGLFSMPSGLMRAAIEIDTEQLKEWNSYDMEQVKARLRKRVPYITDLNLLDVGIFYRAIRRQAKEFARDGIVLIGDATHTTHPMLGQGMSMVFNDISLLTKTRRFKSFRLIRLFAAQEI